MAKDKRRPTTYKDWLTKDGLLKLEAWARDGLTNEQIANNIGIAEGTIYAWMNKYPKIDEALKKGKQVVDIEVENALLKRALGYSYNEVKREIYPDGTEKQVVTTKEVAPDTTAQIFWLKNRKPDNWRDRKEQNITGEINTNPFNGLTTEELKKIIDK